MKSLFPFQKMKKKGCIQTVSNLFFYIMDASFKLIYSKTRYEVGYIVAGQDGSLRVHFWGLLLVRSKEIPTVSHFLTLRR